MGMTIDVLVSVIGSPWRVYPDKDKMRWYRAEYRFSDDVECSGGKPDYVKSVTTLAALHECLKPQYVIVVAQDTILVKNPEELRGDYGYDDVIRDAKSIVEEFLRRADMDVGRGGEVRKGNIYEEVGSKLSVIVAPGSGRFESSMSVGAEEVTVDLEVCGSLEDYYSYLLLSLASHMLAIIEREGQLSQLKVHLDLSHGINYMPALTYKAVTDLLPVIAAYIEEGEERKEKEGKERVVVVKLSTYNSEPVLKDGDISMIHRVEELKVREGGNFGLAPSYEIPSQSTPRLLKLNKYCAEKAKPNEVGKLGRKVGDLSGELVKRLNLDGIRLSAFAGSLANGLPLLLLETMPTTRLHDYVEQVLCEYRRNVVVNFSVKDNSRVEVRMFRLARLPRDTVVVAKLLLASEIIKSKPKLTNTRYSDDGVNIRDLNSLVDVAFSWSERLRLTTSHELRSIKTMVNDMRNQEKLRAGEWTRYADVMCTHEPKGLCELEGEESECSKCECNILDMANERRNFLQHAGLHRCLVMAKVQDGDVWLKYDFELCEEIRNKVYDVAYSGLVRAT
jgi:CRISPR-associated protein Csx1